MFYLFETAAAEFIRNCRRSGLVNCNDNDDPDHDNTAAAAGSSPEHYCAWLEPRLGIAV
jgi:hypothetical protein